MEIASLDALNHVNHSSLTVLEVAPVKAKATAMRLEREKTRHMQGDVEAGPPS